MDGNYSVTILALPELVKSVITAIKNKIIIISKQRHFSLEKEIERMREFAKEQNVEPNEDILYGFELGFKMFLNKCN